MSKPNVNILPPVYDDGPQPYYQAVTVRDEENARVRIYKIPDRVIPQGKITKSTFYIL